MASLAKTQPQAYFLKKRHVSQQNDISHSQAARNSLVLCCTCHAVIILRSPATLARPSAQLAILTRRDTPKAIAMLFPATWDSLSLLPVADSLKEIRERLAQCWQTLVRTE